MQFVATPTKPADIPIRAMLDIPELPDEYAVLVGFDPSHDDTAFLTVLHRGHLYSIKTTTETHVPVVSYAISNALEFTPEGSAS